MKIFHLIVLIFSISIAFSANIIAKYANAKMIRYDAIPENTKMIVKDVNNENSKKYDNIAINLSKIATEKLAKNTKLFKNQLIDTAHKNTVHEISETKSKDGNMQTNAKEAKYDPRMSEKKTIDHQKNTNNEEAKKIEELSQEFVSMVFAKMNEELSAMNQDEEADGFNKSYGEEVFQGELFKEYGKRIADSINLDLVGARQ